MSGAYWKLVLERGLEVPSDRPLHELTAELTRMLRSTDPELRDGTAYPALGTWIDRGAMAFAVFGFSVPVFVVGYLLAYVFALQLDWVPVQGYTPLSQGFWPWLRNLILPAMTLGPVYIALIARITRATMLEVLQQDYVRTAQAKGVGQRDVLFLHALKNAAVPIVTIIGIGIALLIGGAVVTESVFAIPGLGRLTVDAILRRDYPVIQGVVLMFSLVYVLVNLIIDLTYTIVDPRIRY